jgi:hypothetical protein
MYFRASKRKKKNTLSSKILFFVIFGVFFLRKNAYFTGESTIPTWNSKRAPPLGGDPADSIASLQNDGKELPTIP